MSRNIQISEDLFADLLIYFGVQTDPEPTPEHYQQIHDQLALKVQSINNRINYKRGIGYNKENTPAQNAVVPAYKETSEDIAEQRRLDQLYAQGKQLGYHD